MNLFITNLLHLLTVNGPMLVSLFLFMVIEEMCIPLSGEPILLVAAITAGTTHNLTLFLVLTVVSLAGSMVGSIIGFSMGRFGGFRLFYRYGHLVRLKESKVKLGMYLFHKYGGVVALFGRCLPLVRVYVPFLAGTYQMRWLHFILTNLAGTCITVAIYGGGSYILGNVMQGADGIIGIVGMAIAGIILLVLFLLLRRYQHQLEQEAERLFPGSLKEYPSRSRREALLEQEDTSNRSMVGATPLE
jgi:membrane protein DedA with SNARE-associated domain